MSRLQNAPSSEVSINDFFPDEQLFAIMGEPWFADIVNYLVTRKIPAEWSKQDRYRFHAQMKYFYWDDPYLFKYCPDQILEDVFQIMNIKVYSPFVTIKRAEDTLGKRKLQKRFCSVDFTGQLYLKTRTNTAKVVRNVNT